jgi:predicted DNA-binding WGR domain protein
MARYEFWQIDLKGPSFTTTYGKLGAAGQTTLTQFRTDAAAKKEHDKLVAEKVKKGYRLVGRVGGRAAEACEAGQAREAEASVAVEREGHELPAAPPLRAPGGECPRWVLLDHGGGPCGRRRSFQPTTPRADPSCCSR